MLSSLLFVNGAEGGEAFPEVTTGSRTWTMADGSTRKLRFVEFEKKEVVAIFQWGGRAPGGILLGTLSPESRAFLDAIRDGRIKLLKTPGLSAESDFPAGPIRRDYLAEYRVGDLREWMRRDGRKIRASVVNLNDEIVSLLMGDRAWNLPLGDLSDTDHRYLDDLRSGRARTVPLRVPLVGVNVSAHGNQVIGEPKNGHRFEEALAMAIETVRSKLDKKFWKFQELREVTVPPLPRAADWKFLAPPDRSEIGRDILYYEATFHLTDEGRARAVALWPHTVSPPDGQVQSKLIIHLAPNAELATVVPPQP